MISGKVHSIDTFSTLDGPGIRTVVFMQGCHLRCQYCHNPDTWDCHAATAREYGSQELYKLILRNLPYFQASGGGVTFSGGEPLLQHKFVKEVFAACKQSHIHTALDTSLYIASDIMLDLLPLTDLVLADVKQINDEKSRELTGAGNRLNLANLRLINEYKVEIWIRYVIVPGLTDNEADVEALGDFISSLNSIKRVDLLPYHSLGSHKWKLLGLEYTLADTTPPTPSHMRELKYKLEQTSHKPVYIPA